MQDNAALSDDTLLSVLEASRHFGIPVDWFRKQIRLGRVPTRKIWRSGSYVTGASVAVWKDLARRYRSRGLETGLGLPYNPLCSTIMTPLAYESFRLVYGVEPVCMVCGRHLLPGTSWRWFVPARYQRHEDEGEPALAIGCARGHEGQIIEVLGVRWLIAPESVVPRRVATVEEGQVVGS